MGRRRAGWIGLAALALVLAGCVTKVELAQGRWMATCDDVDWRTCEDVGEVFINNLAWSEEQFRREASGVLIVTRMDECPPPPEWGVAGACWRAQAPTKTARACMIVMRQTIAAGGAYGQAGGDNYTGLMGAPKPGTTPC